MARKSKLIGDNKQFNSDGNGNNAACFPSRIPVSVRISKQIEIIEPMVEKICPNAEETRTSSEKTCLQGKVEQVSGGKTCSKVKVEPTEEPDVQKSEVDLSPPSSCSIPMRGSTNDEAAVKVPSSKLRGSSLSCGANFSRFPTVSMKPTHDLPKFPAPANSIVPYAVQNDNGKEPSPDQVRHASFQLARTPRAEHSTSHASSAGSSSPGKISRVRAIPPSSVPLTKKSGTGTYVNLFYKKKAFDKMGSGSLRSPSREQAVALYTPEPTPPPNDQVRFAKVVTEYEVITELDFEEEEEKFKKLEETELGSNLGATPNPSTPVSSVGSSATTVPKKNAKINPKRKISKSPATPKKSSKPSATIPEAPIPAKSYTEKFEEAAKNSQRKLRKEKTKEKFQSTPPQPPPPPLQSEPSTPTSPKMQSKTQNDQCEEKPDDEDYNDTPSSESVSYGKLPNSEVISAKISHVILPGHGNLRMARPQMKSPAQKSSTPLESRLTQTPTPTTKVSSPPENVCKKCAHLKKLLNQADETLHYLNELLKIKEKELEFARNLNLITCPPSNNSLTRDRSTNTSQRQSIIALNPLLAKLFKDNSEHKRPNASAGSTNESTTPRGANTTPCAIPKFDLDEFIRKFLKHSILLSEDYSNLTQLDPFEYAQIFRAALAARDCLAQAVKHKLKHGYHTLKRQYELLISMRSKSSNEDPLEDVYYLKLVDSHRRFVRFIYYFLKTSIEDVETFEQSYIPLQRRTPNAYPMRYSKETTMTIDGVRYSGVFIPLSTIQKNESRSKK